MAGSERDKATLHSFGPHSPFCQHFLAKPYAKAEVREAEGAWLIHARLLQLPGAQRGQGRTAIRAGWKQTSRTSQSLRGHAPTEEAKETQETTDTLRSGAQASVTCRQASSPSLQSGVVAHNCHLSFQIAKAGGSL